MHNCTKRQQSCMAWPGGAGWPHRNEPTATAVNKSFALASLLRVRVRVRARLGLGSPHASDQSNIHPSLLDHRSSCARCTKNRRFHPVRRQQIQKKHRHDRFLSVQARGGGAWRAHKSAQPTGFGRAGAGRGGGDGGDRTRSAPVRWETWHVQPPPARPLFGCQSRRKAPGAHGARGRAHCRWRLAAA